LAKAENRCLAVTIFIINSNAIGLILVAITNLGGDIQAIRYRPSKLIINRVEIGSFRIYQSHCKPGLID